eukprot:2147089-Rhodomonas_salina.1
MPLPTISSKSTPSSTDARSASSACCSFCSFCSRPRPRHSSACPHVERCALDLAVELKGSSRLQREEEEEEE